MQGGAFVQLRQVKVHSEHVYNALFQTDQVRDEYVPLGPRMMRPRLPRERHPERYSPVSSDGSRSPLAEDEACVKLPWSCKNDFRLPWSV